MPGTVTVIAAPPGFGRAGRIRVSVDGTMVGKVRQGASLELMVEPGDHRFRVSGGGSRSKTVALSVAEDSQQHLYSGVHPGLALGTLMGLAVLGYFAGVFAALPFLLLFSIPGSWLYLRVSALSQSAEALEDAEEEAARATSGEPWWITDPNLAKRYGPRVR